MSTNSIEAGHLLAFIERMTLSDLVSVWDRVEIWRPVAGWPYEVSSWGSVRRKGDSLALGTSLTGKYLHVTMSKEGHRITARVHKLVANAFLGEPPFENAEVAHSDGKSWNCRSSNLRWASATENQADRIRHKTDIRGSDVFGSKLHESEIPGIVALIQAGERYPAIAREYGVSISTISLIKQGRIWRHVNPFARGDAA